MRRIFPVFMLSIALFLTGCFYKSYFQDEDWAYFEDWDLDDNGTIDSAEFSRGYIESDFFDMWSENSKAIKYNELYRRIFESIDLGDDGMLDTAELTSPKAKLYFAAPEGGNMNQGDFIQFLTASKTAEAYDRNKDQKITDVEMAQTMFARSDDNGDNLVGSLEFYDWEILR